MKKFIVSLFGLGRWFCHRRGCLYKKPYADCARWKDHIEKGKK